MLANKEGNVRCYIGIKPTAQFNGSEWSHYGPYKNAEEAAKALRERGWRRLKSMDGRPMDWWEIEGKKYLTAEIQTIRPKPRNKLPRDIY